MAGRMYQGLMAEIMRAERQAKGDEIAHEAARDAFFNTAAQLAAVAVTITVGGMTYAITATPSKSDLNAV